MECPYCGNEDTNHEDYKDVDHATKTAIFWCNGCGSRWKVTIMAIDVGVRYDAVGH